MHIVLPLGMFALRLIETSTDHQGATALVAAELSRYKIDSAALCDTILADEGSLTEVGEGYTFFWKGLTSDFQRIRGLGFAIRVKSITRNSCCNQRATHDTRSASCQKWVYDHYLCLSPDT